MNSARSIEEAKGLVQTMFRHMLKYHRNETCIAQPVSELTNDILARRNSGIVLQMEKFRHMEWLIKGKKPSCCRFKVLDDAMRSVPGVRERTPELTNTRRVNYKLQHIARIWPNDEKFDWNIQEEETTAAIPRM